MAASDFLKQLSPGQIATLTQAAGHWREVRCERVGEDSVTLSFHGNRGDGAIALVSKTHFQTIVEGGVIHVEGSLTALNPADKSLGVVFTPSPDFTPIITNRRQAFRVPLNLKATLRGVTTSSKDDFDTEWDVTLRDLSVGGARLSVGPPAVRARSHALLRLTLPGDSSPMNLPCRVIHSQMDKSPKADAATVRVAFEDLSTRMESVLFRYINFVQLDMIKRGLR